MHIPQSVNPSDTPPASGAAGTSDGTASAIGAAPERVTATPAPSPAGAGALADAELEAVSGGAAADGSVIDALYDWAARTFGPSPKS